MTRSGRRDLPLMLIGTLLIGVSGYVFLALIGHGRFDAMTTAALSSTYLLANVLGPGVFVASEQETSRVVSDALARGSVAARFGRRLALVSTALGGLDLAVLVLIAPVLLTKVLGGDIGLVLALMLSIIGSASVFYVRGMMGGQRRFVRYATTLLVDGFARIVGCLALVAIGSTNPTAFALALCLGPAVAFLCTWPGSRVSSPRISATGNSPSGIAPHEISPPDVRVLAKDVGLLLIASVLSMALANLSPVVVTGLLPVAPELAAGFAAAVVLTRIPLLLMGPIQALLLPRMTAAAAAGARAALGRDLLLGLAILLGLGVIASAVTAVAGSWVIRILFGADLETTSTAGLVLLTISAVLFMAVQLLQPALIAIRRHRGLMLAWLAGGIGFAICLALPLDPVSCGVLAQLAGPSITLMIQLVILGDYLRGTADERSLRGGTHPTSRQ